MDLRALIFAVLLTGCSQPTDQQAIVAEAVDAARAKYEASLDAGHAWRKTRVRLEAADAALAEGDLARAQSEADQVVRLAEASLAQARVEADAWKARLPSRLPGE